ncbi:MAG: hypothetical protein HQK81_12070 [Desulfovibrionaceae bacterium]|nr:hypothetical protein [Desulfovibrionaceae bacterium]MBF0514779.1 hypothetical protein [Desulfovibrionaceae bacterium]
MQLPSGGANNGNPMLPQSKSNLQGALDAYGTGNAGNTTNSANAGNTAGAVNGGPQTASTQTAPPVPSDQSQGKSLQELAQANQSPSQIVNLFAGGS